MKTIRTKNEIEYHKCVDILIFNDKSELALQMRSTNDKSFPDHWDFSAGGHVESQEGSQRAAKREVDVSIYRMSHNGPFNIDAKEVKKVVFLSLSTIQKMIDEGSNFHPEFLLTWKKGIITKAAEI